MLFVFISLACSLLLLLWKTYFLWALRSCKQQFFFACVNLICPKNLKCSPQFCRSLSGTKSRLLKLLMANCQFYRFLMHLLSLSTFLAFSLRLCRSSFIALSFPEFLSDSLSLGRQRSKQFFFLHVCAFRAIPVNFVPYECKGRKFERNYCCVQR